MAKPRDELVFAALGGLGEIGMNLYLYGYGRPHARQWLMVDCGVTFADASLPGIDTVLPDIRYIEEERRRLRGIVLTHGHEDHLGALIDLWPRLGAPVYATPFTAGLLRAKMRDEPASPQIEIIEVAPGSTIDLAPFTVELVTLTHSIPEPNGLAIATPLGTVFHSGDWKLDDAPVVGDTVDTGRLKALGDAGVRALICDSTNAFREGSSPSEAEVGASLTRLIAEAKGRVAVTAFASNIARLCSVIAAAQACDRQVVVVGRAMHRALLVAQETGYLDDVEPFVSEQDYGYLPRDKVVVLLTGSQGEPRSALARIAMDEHPAIGFSPGDTVIYSSRTIPGNERPVARIHNALVRMGLRVITDMDGLVHVSGHPRRGELERMYEWIRPELLVPMHGEARHLAEHARFARTRGIKEAATVYNGEVLRLAPGPAEVVDQIPAGRLYRDGRLTVAEGGEAQRERQRMAHNGMVMVALALNGKGDLVGLPQVRLAGVPDPLGEEGGMLDEVLGAVDGVVESIPRPRRKDPDLVAEAVRRGVRSTLVGLWGKRPVCEVIVTRV